MIPLVRRVSTVVGSRCLRFSSSVAADEIVVRLVSVNDVYNLQALPKLATFISSLGGGEGKERVETSFDDTIPASAVTLNGA